MTMVKSPSSRWWQLKYVLCSPRFLGEDEPILTNIFTYFSKGLVQPPTSHVFEKLHGNIKMEGIIHLQVVTGRKVACLHVCLFPEGKSDEMGFWGDRCLSNHNCYCIFCLGVSLLNLESTGIILS